MTSRMDKTYKVSFGILFSCKIEKDLIGFRAAKLQTSHAVEEIYPAFGPFILLENESVYNWISGSPALCVPATTVETRGYRGAMGYLRLAFHFFFRKNFKCQATVLFYYPYSLNRNQNQLSLLKNLLTIVEGCINNDRKCQKALYEHYYGYAMKIVFRYIFRHDKAVDVTNDGFVKVFRNFSRFEYNRPEEAEMQLMGWMRRIMVNTAIDELRRCHMVPEVGYVPEHIWEPADPAQQSDQAVLYKELMIQVRKLPPSYRAVFNMHVIDGFSHPEIAEQLGITVGTCKSNLSKAREYLKKTIDKDLPVANVCNL